MSKPINAVLTGATGFIGSAVAELILQSGGNVCALVRKDSLNRSRLSQHPRLSVVEGDLSSLASCREALAQHAPDVFLHLAWDGVGNAQRNESIQLGNIQTTVDTVQLAAELGCRRWIGAGSQAEYGPLNRRISENDPLQPTTLYGAAKASACLLSGVAGANLGIETAWVRIFSTYGPGDNSGWMLVDVIKQLMAGKKPALTPGEQLWDYLYVDDAARAFLELATASGVSGVYNLGSGCSHTIRHIVTVARDLVAPSLPLGFGEVPYRKDQVMHLEADCGRLSKDTGWEPKVTIEIGISLLVHSLKRTQ